MTSPESKKPIIPDRLLLGDDQNSIRALFEALLNAHGITVKTVGDPDELLEEYERNQRSYDLVSTDYDYSMGPKKTGLYVATQLKRITEAPLPVAIVSGFTFSEVESRALQKVAELRFGKPFRIEVILEEIKRNPLVQTMLRDRREFYKTC